MHAVGGERQYNDDARQHGRPTISLLQFMASSRFWYQSFQNWQSEFLSVGVLVLLSVYLRHKGSPESKPVHYAHRRSEA